jgi:hypothetical protein
MRLDNSAIVVGFGLPGDIGSFAGGSVIMSPIFDSDL